MRANHISLPGPERPGSKGRVAAFAATMAAAVVLCCFAGEPVFADATTTVPAPSTPSTNRPAAPSPAMVQAFQLGYDVYLPVAQMQFFDHEVQTLSGITSDAEARAKVADLNKLADRTRLIEQISMKQTVDLMKQMSVPATVRAPYEQAAAKLAQPLPIAKDARNLVKSDPASAHILSTMEEADALIPSDTTELTTWVKIARGPDADWSFHVGSLEASLAAASDNSAPAVALLSTIPALVTKTPVTAPDGARDTMMDLAHDIYLKQDITQPMLADAARALHKAFEGD